MTGEISFAIPGTSAQSAAEMKKNRRRQGKPSREREAQNSSPFLEKGEKERRPVPSTPPPKKSPWSPEAEQLRGRGRSRTLSLGGERGRSTLQTGESAPCPRGKGSIRLGRDAPSGGKKKKERVGGKGTLKAKTQKPAARSERKAGGPGGEEIGCGPPSLPGKSEARVFWSASQGEKGGRGQVARGNPVTKPPSSSVRGSAEPE